MNDGKEKTPAGEFGDAVRHAWDYPEVPDALDRAILARAQAQANYFRLRRLRAPQRRMAACAVALVGLCACCGVVLNWQREKTAQVAVSDPAVDDMVNQAAVVQARAAEHSPVRQKIPARHYAWDEFDNKLLDLESDVVMARSAEIRGNFNQN